MQQSNYSKMGYLGQYCVPRYSPYMRAMPLTEKMTVILDEKSHLNSSMSQKIYVSSGTEGGSSLPQGEKGVPRVVFHMVHVEANFITKVQSSRVAILIHSNSLICVL